MAQKLVFVKLLHRSAAERNQPNLTLWKAAVAKDFRYHLWTLQLYRDKFIDLESTAVGFCLVLSVIRQTKQASTGRMSHVFCSVA